MIKVSRVVEEIVQSSEVARSALTDGYLNLNAYARSIKDDVEAKAKKPVKIGSIVVALSRLGRMLQRATPLIPEIEIINLSVRSGLTELTYNRTPENLAILRQVYQKAKLRATDFFTVSQGTGEITIISIEQAMSSIRHLFGRQKPKALIRGLSSLTIEFVTEYIGTPNIFFAFIRCLALQRINIVEVVSTYTEFTLILGEQDLERAFSIVNATFKQRSGR